MRMQAVGGPSSSVPPPSPIVIQPMHDDHHGRHGSSALQSALPAPPSRRGSHGSSTPSPHSAVAAAAMNMFSLGSTAHPHRPGASPHGSNTPSPQQVGSTTGTSPETRRQSSHEYR